MLYPSLSKIRTFIGEWTNKINNLFYKETWIQRCEQMQEWEKTHDISKEDKYKKYSHEDNNKKAAREKRKRRFSGRKKKIIILWIPIYMIR
jgi:hypothetical protein